MATLKSLVQAVPPELQLISAVLQYNSVLSSDQGSIARLLSASQATACLVHLHCKGQLHANLCPDLTEKTMGFKEEAQCAIKQKAAWLRGNGSLVRDILCYPGWYVTASTRDGRHTVFGTLLPVIAASCPSLTFLKGSLFISSPSIAAAASSLAALTALQSLTLQLVHANAGEGPAQVLAALQHLSALSHCDISLEDSDQQEYMPLSKAGLQFLPPTLRSLGLSLRRGLKRSDSVAINAALDFAMQVGVQAFSEIFEDMDEEAQGSNDSSHAQPLDLGHLTALQVLKPSSIYVRQNSLHRVELAMLEGDVLPPSLTSLVLDADHKRLLSRVFAAPTVAPLLPLKQLKVLQINDSAASPEQLQQLASALKPPSGSLQQVALAYTSWETAATAARGWQHLPLASLTMLHSIWDQAVQQGMFAPRPADAAQDADDAGANTPVKLVLAAVAQLTALTCLKCVDLCDARVKARQLATALASLTTLQELEFANSGMDSRSLEEAGSPADQQALAQAIAALPHLKKLQLDPPVPGIAGALVSGACAQQLTHVSLEGQTTAELQLLRSSLASHAAVTCRWGWYASSDDEGDDEVDAPVCESDDFYGV